MVLLPAQTQRKRHAGQVCLENLFSRKAFASFHFPVCTEAHFWIKKNKQTNKKISKLKREQQQWIPVQTKAVKSQGGCRVLLVAPCFVHPVLHPENVQACRPQGQQGHAPCPRQGSLLTTELLFKLRRTWFCPAKSSSILSPSEFALLGIFLLSVPSP